MDHFIITNIDMIVRPTIAMFLGGLLGVERLFAGKTAGMRTYSLVSMGSAIFVLVGLIVSGWSFGSVGYLSVDPTRMASQVIVGVGFLGAGLIFFRDQKLNGLTTAAGLWVAAGVGISIGFGLIAIGVITTLLTLFIFTVLGAVKKRLERSSLAFPDRHISTDHDDEM